MKNMKTLLSVLIAACIFFTLALTINNNFSNKININTCSIEALESLDGIGPILAQRIIEGRPYTDIWELDAVKGIGPKTIEKIRERVVCK
jgi:competence ComEA-like helix-hairpin-helix protein